MTLQLLHSEFLKYKENLIFFFISVAGKTYKERSAELGL
jgi:hypothetical protein